MSVDSSAALIEARIRESAELQLKLIEPETTRVIADAAALMTRSLRNGGKVLFFGNGGSAADAQHLAAELVGRYMKERGALPAIALTANSSNITAIGNDYSYDWVFKRQIEALCRPEDVAFGISTSGNSRNVIAGLDAARAVGAVTIGLTGEGGGAVAGAAEVCIRFPSPDTPRIQEGHTLIGHILCEIVEDSAARRD